MVITDRNLNVGERFEAERDGVKYVIESVNYDDDKIAFKLVEPKGLKIREGTGVIGENVFGSLSSAAGAVTNGKAGNGWVFWSRAAVQVPIRRNRRKAAA